MLISQFETILFVCFTPQQDGDTVLMKAINPFQPPKASNPYYSVQPVAQPAAPTEEDTIKTIELLINAGAELNARNEVRNHVAQQTFEVD